MCRKILTITLLGLISILPAAGASAPSLHQLDPEARKNLFERFKATESESHLEWIKILESAEQCIQQAADRHAYRTCEQTERKARKALRQHIKAERLELREELARLRQQ
ncbi:hypothetical protein [endosymbiont of Ridgeia piscesae]|jgi:hypothetical protein|uniref:Uncharacterized protein n=1 Tax=endosymbiont of Ridgeia piscesae TaxID=54398 RepID=A0A0T5YXQ3_9GAMM|nr:hypothetical protein [endosymbiont of Ridgeia piscesae]KRT55394.1 hypothetical protein Ga0074115_11756 [endosymbiont of Ridgeia piscesae]KRT59772.1 hypothetical protein Ga0076813_15998 [endosymbiont of Ridgeia piscesae]